MTSRDVQSKMIYFQNGIHLMDYPSLLKAHMNYQSLMIRLKQEFEEFPIKPFKEQKKSS